MKQQLQVVAALLEQGGRFLICQRPSHKAQGDLWEFAGGKIEPGETPQQALERECREELAVEIQADELFMEVVHEYDDRIVQLLVLRAVLKSGEPTALEHQAMAWVTPQQMMEYDFCPADLPILERLCQQEN